MHQTEFLKRHGFHPNPHAVRQMRQQLVPMGKKLTQTFSDGPAGHRRPAEWPS